MTESLRGQVAIVTGASRGIGAAIAERLEGADAMVVGLSRSLPEGRTGRRWQLQCDLREPAQVSDRLSEVVDELGPPHIVVCNAGAFMVAPLEETSIEDFDDQVSLNLRAPFVLARELLPGMRRAGRGRLLTVGSIVDHRAFPDNAAYAATKWGLRGLHLVLREEFRGSGVRCTLLSPGPTDTAAWDPVNPDEREGFLSRSAMLRPGDVADAALFIATRPPHVDIDWVRIDPA